MTRSAEDAHQPADAERGSSHATRLFAAVMLGAVAVLPLRAGTALPPWIIRLGELVGIDGDHAARWLAALLATSALLAALWPAAAARAIAFGGGLALLAGLASIGGAAAMAGTSSIAAAVLVASIVVAAIGLGCIAWLAPRATPPLRRRGASAVWQLLGGIATLTVTLGLAAEIPVRSTRALMTATPFDQGNGNAGPSPAGATDSPNASAAPTTQMITFDLDAWEGRSLAETGLYAYLPELAALVRDGTVFVIFYNPRCGDCHELFEAYFAGPLDEPVIAIEIPPPPGVPLAESDQPAAINCPECQHLRLPETIFWGVTPPAVVRIRDGMVECAVEANAFAGRDCISR